MITLVRQPGGLGDILWTMQMALSYEPSDIIWPVPLVYSNLNEYLDTPIQFVWDEDDFPYKDVWQTRKDKFTTDDLNYLPFQYMQKDGFSVMRGKYECMRESHRISSWKNAITIKRNFEKENRLKDQVSGPFLGNYAFINNTIGTPPGMIELDHKMETDSDLQIIRSRLINGYSIFDWIGVMMDAKEIHTPDTSFSWLVECIKPEAKLFMYPRDLTITQNFSSASVREYLQLDWKYREFPNG